MSVYWPIMVGPAPCRSCTTPLYYVRALGWKERVVHRHGLSRRPEFAFRRHKCPARELLRTVTPIGAP